MGYKLNVIPKNNYINITASGTQTMENNIKLAADSVEACKKYKLSRVLIDIQGLSGQPGTLADYELAKLLTAWETAKTVTRAALVEKESDLPAGRFFETTARNRGINLAVFSDPEKAEKWISG